MEGKGRGQWGEVWMHVGRERDPVVPTLRSSFLFLSLANSESLCLFNSLLYLRCRRLPQCAVSLTHVSFYIMQRSVIRFTFIYYHCCSYLSINFLVVQTIAHSYPRDQIRIQYIHSTQYFSHSYVHDAVNISWISSQNNHLYDIYVNQIFIFQSRIKRICSRVDFCTNNIHACTNVCEYPSPLEIKDI